MRRNLSLCDFLMGDNIDAFAKSIRWAAMAKVGLDKASLTRDVYV